ncbi:MAG: hydrolase 1, exosortase A system-associated [Pseudohongiellaceae bacterium]
MTDTISGQGEVAFAFKCHEDELIGFLHAGDQRCDIGVLTLVAGGPQYRGGVGRQLVNLGRRLSSEGIPVMRFDHRGTGDSEGSFRRFSAMCDDIAAAIREFRIRAPHVRGVILWGGCDSATSALINAHKLPEVISVIAGNPFASSPVTSRKVARKHYLSRLGHASFWKKAVRMEYNPVDYAAAALRKSWGKIHKIPRDREPGRQTGTGDDNFINDLLTGLQNFDGKVLFLMGDRFLLSDEFDALMDSSPGWRSAYGKSTHDRIDIQGGDQVFSSTQAQDRMFDAASEWIHGAFPESVPSKDPSGWRQNAQEQEQTPV